MESVKNIQERERERATPNLENINKAGLVHSVVIAKMRAKQISRVGEDFFIMAVTDEIQNIKLSSGKKHNTYTGLSVVNMNRTDIEYFKSNRNKYEVHTQDENGKVYELKNKSLKEYYQKSINVG